MRNTVFVALIMIASVTATSVAASAQEAPRSEPREAVVQLWANQHPQDTGWEIAQTTMSAGLALPDAPMPAARSLAYSPLSLAVPQQQGGSNLPATYPVSNKRKYIVLGVICAAGIVGAIVIATQRD